MLQRIGNHAAMMVLGLFVGAVLMAAWSGVGSSPTLGTQVQAMATHGEDNFAIATGLIDDRIEAFYFLDYLTGDLRAAVVSRRNGKFTSLFQRNILQDFGSLGKDPKFLMVTGMAGLPRGPGNTQLGSGLIYIAEASSGQVKAYALPWNATLNKKGQVQRGGFILLAEGAFRSTFVRDEE